MPPLGEMMPSMDNFQGGHTFIIRPPFMPSQDKDSTR